jgi:ferredoxin
MNLRYLRKVRLGVSIGFFVLIGALYLDFGNRFPGWLHTVLLSLQLIPSFLNLFVAVGTSLFGLLVVVALTLTFGRVYCSSLCPLGTLQDVLIHFSNKKRGKRRFRYTKPPDIVHYGVLGVTVLLLLAGSLTAVNLLDPFSNFGRIVTNLVRPAVIWTNNVASAALNDAGVYLLYTLPIARFEYGVILFSLLSLALVVVLSYSQGRLFCNLLCPVGALLKLISRISLYRIVIDVNTCSECGLCEKVCKANCIDADEKTIDFGSCVSCFNCIDACPTVGVVYQGWRGKRQAAEVDTIDAGRRKILGSFVAAGFVGGSATLDTARIDSASTSLGRSKLPVTPPGSFGIGRFSDLCTACHLCVSACPTQVITPALLEYGLQGIFQPRLDYTEAYCKYDCNECGKVCPTGAIVALDIEARKQVQVGKATFVKEDCIVVTKKTECGACSEHCPTKAVNMVPYENLRLPELNNDICVGCGACERPCPTKPRKAIFVESNRIHLRAKKPEVKNMERPLEELQEFPF